jgi:methionyl-tRNA formyltransferase
MHGVTVHWMDAGIDTGDVAYEAHFEIAPEDTAFTLSAKGVRAALPLLRALLQDAAAEPPRVPRGRQRTVPRRYHGREVPNGGRLAWDAPAEHVERFVRAADYGPFPSPWGGPRATLPGVGDVELVKVARTGQPTDAAPGTIAGPVPGGALVACGDEWLLVTKVRVGGVLCAAAQLLEAFAGFGGF